MSKLTICGGGNAAHVLIALAGHIGWDVDVFAPLADEAERLQAGVSVRGGILANYGHKTVMGRPRRISATPAEVIPGSELILLALPAFAHGSTLQSIADHLDREVAIGALPARGGFDYQAFSILPNKGVRIFGLQTLPWACRISTYGQEAEILGTKAEVDLAAAPAAELSRITQQLEPLFSSKLSPHSSFLSLTLANTGQLIHPGIMYGLGRGKEGDRFAQDDIPLFYQGVDDPTAHVLQSLSDEVQAIAGAVAAVLPDFNPREVATLHEWILRAYPADIADGSSLRRAFNANRAYVGLKLPSRPVGPNSFAIDYKARYLAEDVPFGLVVLRGIAALVGVRTPTIDEVIIWAQEHLDKQYLVNGELSGPNLVETRAPQIYGIQTLAQLAKA
jgi:hypothetical protein